METVTLTSNDGTEKVNHEVYKWNNAEGEILQISGDSDILEGKDFNNQWYMEEHFPITFGKATPEEAKEWAKDEREDTGQDSCDAVFTILGIDRDTYKENNTNPSDKLVVKTLLVDEFITIHFDPTAGLLPRKESKNES